MKTLWKIIYWSPRILGIIMVLFIGMFALDVFGEKLTIWEMAGAFLIHLIPAFLALATVLIAWKWDLAGTVIYYTLAIAYAFSVLQHPLWILSISGPLFIIGTLFFLSYYYKKKSSIVQS